MCVYSVEYRPGTEVIKLFMLNTTEHGTSNAQKTKKLKFNDFSCFNTLKCCIYLAHKRSNANNCWHLNVYEQDKLSAQLR